MEYRSKKENIFFSQIFIVLVFVKSIWWRSFALFCISKITIWKKTTTKNARVEILFTYWNAIFFEQNTMDFFLNFLFYNYEVLLDFKVNQKVM